MEEPSLRVETRSTEVIRYADLGSCVPEFVEGASLGRFRVDGCEHAELTPGRAMAPECAEERGDAAAADEGHHDVDPVRRVDLGDDLAADTRLTRRIG